MGRLTTHVLDTARGTPGSGIEVRLYRAGPRGYEIVKSMVTNADGTQTAISLSDAGIASIDLSANNVRRVLSDGSAIDGETTYTRTDGSTGTAAWCGFRSMKRSS